MGALLVSKNRYNLVWETICLIYNSHTILNLVLFCSICFADQRIKITHFFFFKTSTLRLDMKFGILAALAPCCFGSRES